MSEKKRQDRATDSNSQSRREFLKTTGLAGAGIVIAPAFIKSALGDSLHNGTELFPLGVASGDPGAGFVVLWTRLVEDPLTGQGLPAKNIPLAWEVATDHAMRDVIARGTTVARPESGHAVNVPVRGLPDDLWLYYRFFAKGGFRGQQSRVGRTRTFPSRGRRYGGKRYGVACRTESMRFAVVSCQNYTQGFYPAWGDIAAQDLDFVVHTGDYIYEGGASSNPLIETRNHVGGEIFTVEEYRNRYALYRLDANLQEAHARLPFIVTWDDHEVDNNYAGKIAEVGAPFEGEAFLERRRNAFQAYAESMPIRTVARRSNRQPDVREYFPLARQLKFGDLADIHVLDTRQFRTDQPAGDGFGSTAVPDPAVAATLEAVFGEELFDRNGIVDTQATLLGWPQELQLAFALATSRARWNVIAQQIMVMPWNLRTTGLLSVQFGPDFPGKQQVLADIANLDDLLNVDAWDGYQAARDRLDNLLAKARPNNPVFLTGDIHSGWAANLLDDYADPANSDVLAAEFVCTSISSTFASADPRPTDAIVRAGIPDNPHIRYFDGRFRGYCLCDVDRQRWRTEYRAVGAPENLLDPAGDALIPMQDDSLFTVAVAEIESGFNTPGSPKGVQVSSIV